MVTDELIEKFLQGQCSAEESSLVERYFLGHPAEMGRLAEEKDWHATDNQGELEGSLGMRMLEEIRQQAYKGPIQYAPAKAEAAVANKGLVRRHIGAWIAAASLMLVVGGWLVSRQWHQERLIVGTAGTAAVDSGQWISRINLADHEMKFDLPDGSTVLLAANSTLRYQQAFAAHQREFYLDGQAFFDVRTDKNRPFKVHSGPLYTTVLGTSFQITAYHGDGITIRLFTGKIMVDGAGVRGKDDIVLNPGDQLHYDAKRSETTLSRFSADGKNVAGAAAGRKKGEPDNKTEVFDNAPFSNVMTRLMKRYGVTIRYNRQETTDIYFSGTIAPTDSLITVLNVIARMNHLQLQKDQDGYLIRGSKE
jgi:ferric-dicitrate binding protein FerR (iron transport regulator)